MVESPSHVGPVQMNFHLPPPPEILTRSRARTAIVLGSGLARLTEEMECHATVPCEDIVGHPQPKVPGHVAEYVVGKLAGVPLIVARGRVHLYEGWSAQEVAFGIRLLYAAGVRRIILTNAAGCLRAKWAGGSWMMLSDHLNLTGQSPLTGQAQFVDQTETYSKELRRKFKKAAKKLGLKLHEGIYAAVRGPEYETPAEVRMLARLGADAVGMSTVPEAIQARALGMEIAAFSCLTNPASGLGAQELSHEEVIQTGKGAADGMVRLLQQTLPGLD